MSADEIKAAFPALRLEMAKRQKLDEHLARGEFAKAAALKEELDGRLPRGQVVMLRRVSTTKERTNGE